MSIKEHLALGKALEEAVKNLERCRLEVDNATARLEVAKKHEHAIWVAFHASRPRWAKEEA